MDTERYEIFIHVKGTGFTFLLDKRMKHNFISPAFLAFFNLGEKGYIHLLMIKREM